MTACTWLHVHVDLFCSYKCVYVCWGHTLLVWDQKHTCFWSPVSSNLSAWHITCCFASYKSSLAHLKWVLCSIWSHTHWVTSEIWFIQRRLFYCMLLKSGHISWPTGLVLSMLCLYMDVYMYNHICLLNLVFLEGLLNLPLFQAGWPEWVYVVITSVPTRLYRILKFSVTSNIHLPFVVCHSYCLFNCRYLKYGALGSVIGHELTHGFDDQDTTSCTCSIHNVTLCIIK